MFALVKPNEDPNIRGDAFKTLIVARLSYEADERDLEREFGRYGPIERVRLPLLNTHRIAKIFRITADNDIDPCRQG